MHSRFTATGLTAEEKEVILAYELMEEAFKVVLHVIPRKGLSSEQVELIETKWVEGEEVQFPEGTQTVDPNLNAESILPDNIRSEEVGKIRTKQNEWAYTLLTAKLWESYLLELESLKAKAQELSGYDRKLFDDAKSFWERVLEHRKERDISQERLDKIKDDVNSIFEKLKTFRKTESAEFEAASSKVRDEFLAKLEDLKSRTNEKANFKSLLDELKGLQNQSRKSKLSKSDETTLRKNFDTLFQFINEQRNHFFSDKNASRIKGLTEVVEKMESSLARDQKDLDYLQKKLDSPKVSSLEAQLIKVKLSMVTESMASKEEKLKDIRATLSNLQKQLDKVSKQKEVSEELVSESNDIAQPKQPDSDGKAESSEQ